MESNAKFVSDELIWFEGVVNARIADYFNVEGNKDVSAQLQKAPACDIDCAYPNFIKAHNLDVAERIYLALSFVPYVRPQLFDCFFIKNSSTGERFSEFGGVVSTNDGHMVPTFTTFLFIVAGNDIEKRLSLTQKYVAHPLFSGHLFTKSSISASDYTIEPSRELVDRILYEQIYSPCFSADFPARKVTTSREWSELVLDQRTFDQLDIIRKWLEYSPVLMNNWGMKGKISNGYRALFFGPSGTGKTLSASLLGKLTGRDVYVVDLSMVVSKYIGETEKNLSKVFDTAEDKDWILFFDEADALFGKRTSVKDAHDRYANQEIAFLLQRVETYNGLVILSTNLKSNIDDAFARRFQSVIRFQMPNAAQRLTLWKSSFPEKARLAEDVDIEAISNKYDISGGSILNVVQYVSLMALGRGSDIITSEDIIEGIRTEYRKEGKIAD